MIGRWMTALGTALLVTGLTAGPASAAGVGSGQSGGTPATAYACAAPTTGFGACGAIQLLHPSRNWHPGPTGHGHGGGGGSSTGLPASGYYPGDLLSAYGLSSVAQFSGGPGPSAPTVAIVDAYDDPYAASDLATYRSTLTGATDSVTGLADPTIPPLCSSPGGSGCVTFTKVNQSGSTSYPRANSSWSEEISLDLDMVSAVCPDCNITLVEASSNSFSNLEQAVSYAKSLHPAAVTNSYGGSEFSSETSYNSVYSSSSSGGTAVTASSGDGGYGVEYPAASPGLTAVGGTSLTFDGSGTWSQTVWSTSSTEGAGSGCSAYEGLPSWQNDQGVYNLSTDCSGRQVADVSAVADPYTGVAVYDTYGLSGWAVFGGTSASAQIIGGVYGLAAGQGGERAAPGGLYVDTGTTNTGPTSGLTPVRSGSTSGCGNYLCNAADSLASGYNGPTGLGTPSGLGAFTGTPHPDFTISASPSSQSVTQGSSASYTVSLSALDGYSGTVNLTASGVPAGSSSSFTPSSVTLSSSATSATSTFKVTTSSTQTGSSTITITGTDSTGSPTHSTTVGLDVVSSSPTSGTMVVAVSPGSPTLRGKNYKVPISVAVTDASSGTALSGAGVTLNVYAGNCPSSGTPSGSSVASGTGTTSSAGTVSFTFSTQAAGLWCAVATVSDTGYSDGTGQHSFST